MRDSAWMEPAFREVFRGCSEGELLSLCLLLRLAARGPVSWHVEEAWISACQSPDVCKARLGPWPVYALAARNGVSAGEAAGLMLLPWW